MNLPKIEALLSRGWDLTVTMRSLGKFHATVHLDQVNGHHYIGSSVAVALERLEQYIDEPEESAQRRETRTIPE